MDKMREEFEVWACNYNLKIADWGNYADRHVNNMWKAWQASRAALCVKLPSFENGSLRGYGGDCEEARAVVDSVAESLEKAGVRYE